MAFTNFALLFLLLVACQPPSWFEPPPLRSTESQRRESNKSTVEGTSAESQRKEQQSTVEGISVESQRREQQSTVEGTSAESQHCNKNSDCDLVSSDCCGCNHGGEMRAIHIDQKARYENLWQQKCAPDISNPRLCRAWYRCNNFSVQCVDSQCQVVTQ